MIDFPTKLKLRQTITSSGPVELPDNLKRVWAVLIGAGGGGDTAHSYYPSPTILSGYVGGSITSAAVNNPSPGFVTYFTNQVVPVGSLVTTSGFTPSGYNGGMTVLQSNPGVSFSAYLSTAGGTVTVPGVFNNIIYLNLSSNNYRIGDFVSISGATPSTFNVTGWVTHINGNTISIRPFGTITIPANTTMSSVGTIRVNTYGGGPGGGGGGFTCGWTTPTANCIIGVGGLGGTSLRTPTAGSSTRFGHLSAGGGGSAYHTRFNSSGTNVGYLGGAGGGTTLQSSGATKSFTGAIYAGSRVSFSNSLLGGTSAVSGSGGNPFYVSTAAETTTSQTVGNGGSGLVGGGAGGGHTTGLITAGSGGSGYLSTGGLGSSGVGYSFGAGGGGAGFMNNGGNASGVNGGNGGLGGGGGGGASGNGDGGNGGNGILYLYY